jgi:hypothetical protein
MTLGKASVELQVVRLARVLTRNPQRLDTSVGQTVLDIA